MSPKFKAAVAAFVAAASAEIEDLEDKINNEEEKDSPNTEEIDSLTINRDDIENVLEAINDIDI